MITHVSDNGQDERTKTVHKAGKVSLPSDGAQKSPEPAQTHGWRELSSTVDRTVSYRGIQGAEGQDAKSTRDQGAKSQGTILFISSSNFIYSIIA